MMEHNTFNQGGRPAFLPLKQLPNGDSNACGQELSGGGSAIRKGAPKKLAPLNISAKPKPQPDITQGVFSPAPMSMTPEQPTMFKGPSNSGKNAMEEEGEETKVRMADPINLQDLQAMEQIGQGAFGTVFKVFHGPTQNIFALKTVRLSGDQEEMKRLKSEVNTLMNCQSEYIIKCHNIYAHEGEMSFCLEYMDLGNLSDLINRVGPIEESFLGFITYQTLKGLDYLHRNMKVIHRDIKPSNLLLNSEGQVKIGDFGVSAKLTNTHSDKNSWVGTTMYMSPERCQGGYYNTDTDIWSLGLTIIECALGKSPYPLPADGTLKFFDMMDFITRQPPPQLPADANFSPALRDFISKCLQKDARRRPSAADLLKHEFVCYFENVPRHLLKGWLQASVCQDKGMSIE